MLKVRVIPILTFNGFGLVKTKRFGTPRMVGNPVQAARVYNSRGVDELVFLDIYASQQSRKINLKLVSDVIKECYMPVSIGGGIQTIDDINDLLRIGADKVVIKTKAIADSEFVKKAVDFFGSQCISIAIDAKIVEGNYVIHNNLNRRISLEDFVAEMDHCGVGEFIVASVDNDGMMAGFDTKLINKVLLLTKQPVVAVGGGGTLEHYQTLFNETSVEAVGSSSIFHFTQTTPLDIKRSLKEIGKQVRL